jgi:hypothetical protein
MIHAYYGVLLDTYRGTEYSNHVKAMYPPQVSQSYYLKVILHSREIPCPELIPVGTLGPWPGLLHMQRQRLVNVDSSDVRDAWGNLNKCPFSRATLYPIGLERRAQNLSPLGRQHISSHLDDVWWRCA